MKQAIIKPKSENSTRLPLWEVIPRETPFKVILEPSSACNIKCDFCYHSDLKAIKEAGVKFGNMSYDLFCSIVDDMKKTWNNAEDKIKKLSFAGLGEPLLNKDICKMVKYAKEANIAEVIEIYTNGLLLTEKFSLDLIEGGLDNLVVSFNGINKTQYQKVCKIDVDFENFIDQIKFFGENRKQCHLHIKYGDIGYSQVEKESFYNMFRDICDDMYVETIQNDIWSDTDVCEKIPKANSNFYGKEIERMLVCPQIFEYMMIRYDGQVSLCCADWKKKCIVGDLRKESVSEIWNGKELREIQKTHLRGEKSKITICNGCTRSEKSMPDNIDAYAEEILKKLENLEDA